MLRALFLAPPGAGKGTQGPRIARLHGVPYLATGDILRDEVTRRTPLGIAVEQYLDRGDLVPDDLVVEMILERISKPTPLEGFVFDGFPRTLAQAEAAYAWGEAEGRTFHAVLSLIVPEEELVRRVADRSRGSGRSDDDVETFRHRLAVYAEETQPLLEYYRDRGILLEVDGTGTVADVAARLDAALARLDLSQ